ncbi:hypothetical protein [Solibacillus sp. NPDC093137]|uniref:hypothetical protein n=1 Tax=Solibacillus sp. NPDC093137 TaxID=3390678 RepID=UPI003CFEB3DC
MREINKSASAKFLSLLKQAISMNKRPFPWVKAFCAGIAASLPVFIGLMFGNFEYGLIAGMGGTPINKV